MNNNYEKIFEYVASLQIIDSHEHLPGWEEKRDGNADVLMEYFSQYITSDMIAMGMKKEELAYIQDVNRPLMERWEMLEPYWELARNTGYGRALNLAANALYDVPCIERNTLEELNTKFQKTLEPGTQHYKRVLKDMSKIEYSLLDSHLGGDPTYFRGVYNINGLVIMLECWDYIEELERKTGIPITSFEEWLKACECEIDKAFQQGAVALKCSLSYERPLLFENVTKQKVESWFNEILVKKGRPKWRSGSFAAPKYVQDYMMHFFLRIANKRGLVFQIHTGLLEGNHNDITRSDPTLLSNLFIQYPNVKFDLFHMGYPYQHTLSALAKMFSNVYLDMCWAHIISPAASISTLNEWLDSVPVGKIIAFGGDYSIVDGVYAHQLMARQNVSKVLADKVKDGIFDVDTVKWMAKRMFYENPKKLYEGK